MEELLEYRRDIISALEGVVPQLDQLTAVIPDAAWHIPSRISGQTPHSILSRWLLMEDQVYTVYLHRIIAENAPHLPLLNVDAWLVEQYDSTTPVQPMIDKLTHLRTHEVAWLRDLPPQGWSRAARHPWWGVRTLQWWVEHQLDESQRHLKALAAFQPP